MIYMSVFSWISTILSIACLVWCVGLGVFVLIKKIIDKVKFKKEQKNIVEEHTNKNKRFYGSEEDDDF